MGEVTFKLISFNAQGIRNFHKRKSVFTGLQEKKATVLFLQETYSIPGIINEWTFQRRAKMHFAHGTNHSRGALVLFNDKLQFELRRIKEDKNGRYIAYIHPYRIRLFCFIM